MSRPPPVDVPPNADAEDVARWQRLLSDSTGTDADDAVAALYWQIRQSPEHGRLIRAIERGDRPKVVEPPHVVVMPGAFHKHHADTGADGSRVLAAATRLGWSAEVLPVGSLSPMAENAGVLIGTLLRSGHPRHVIVSLSKGSADVATAFSHPDAADAMRRVNAWVSLSGLVFGTPLVDWLKRQWWRLPGVYAMLWWMGLRFSEVEELRHGPTGQLHRPPTLPPHLRAIHVLGFPCRKHLRHRWAARGYQRLLPLGPNDGGGILLRDAWRWPGIVFPVWGADHYLQPSWPFEPVLDALLCQAAASQPIASSTPTIKSTT